MTSAVLLGKAGRTASSADEVFTAVFIFFSCSALQ